MVAPRLSIPLMGSGPGDLVFPELLIEGVPANPQTSGCLLLIPVALLQDLLEQDSLIFENGPVRSSRRRGV